MKGIKVLYVEDENALGFIVKESMVSRGLEVYLCRNAVEGLEVFVNNSPDICVLDVMMPGMDGFQMAEEIRKRDKDIPIIFLTARSQTEDVIKGFKLGAHDYIKKPFSIEELLVRMESILERENVLENSNTNISVFQIGDYTFDSDKQVLIYKKKEKKLTHRESEILRMLCENKNDVLPKDAVLVELWGEASFFNGRSMDVFITKLRKYLSKDNGIEIVNVRGVGYKLIY